MKFTLNEMITIKNLVEDSLQCLIEWNQDENQKLDMNLLTKSEKEKYKNLLSIIAKLDKTEI